VVTLYKIADAISSVTAIVRRFSHETRKVKVRANSLPRWGGAMMIFAATLCIANPALAQFTQQGSKLVGTGAVAPSYQGYSSAVSSNGNTVIVGGPLDNGNVGAAWIFTRNVGAWSQQGDKLIGTGAVGPASQGISVAISADGNTAIVGAPDDNNTRGAAWVFTRSGTTWTQQGPKLVGTGAVGVANQGKSVAISADGNTAMVGGYADNGYLGAVWIFTRNGSNWSQQGNKLVGTGAVGNADQGFSTALSADGNTALVGGVADNGSVGAAWIFTRSGSTWTQQGNKLVGTGTVGTATQGYAVALSADGNTAMLGGGADNSTIGASWIFVRSGGTWTQQGSKLVGTGGVGGAYQGNAVSLSADGSTAVAGGNSDNGRTGAAWVFTRTGSSWTQSGSKLVGTGALAGAGQGSAVALSADAKTLVISGRGDNSNRGATWVFAVPGAGLATATHDFNGDGRSDILWRDGGGSVAQWLMNGFAVTANNIIGNIPTSWSVVGQRDFDGDGKSDILWRDGGGSVAIWLMNGATVSSAVTIGYIPANWSVAGTGDFDGNGKGDILWRDGGGNVALWLMNGTVISAAVAIGTIPANWNVVGTGDFDGNGKSDILWRDGGGNVAAWFMNGASLVSVVTLGNIPANWNVVGTGDFDGDNKADILWRDGGGRTDILWRDGGGNVALWQMSGATIVAVVNVGNIPANWAVQGANAD
jgi:hypothetical protein